MSVKRNAGIKECIYLVRPYPVVKKGMQLRQDMTLSKRVYVVVCARHVPYVGLDWLIGVDWNDCVQLVSFKSYMIKRAEEW